MPDRPEIATTSAPCVAHQRHAPTPTYCELHHVIPQGWQGIWRPSAQVLGSLGLTSSPGLWDPRTVALCRTGHGNVHFWLARAMHAHHSEKGDGSPAALDAAFTAALKGFKGKVYSEIAIARQGMERFLAAGGNLDTLTAAGEWGAI